jgi:inorganic triphosphatase YgiF
VAATDPPAWPVEVELKLLLDEDAEDVRNHLLLRRLTRGRSSTKRVRSVYFDTADLALCRQGITVRLRDGGFQTVKLAADGRAGLFTRIEHEARVKGREPDLDAIPDLALRESILAASALRGEPLVPVVETDMMRTKRILVLEGSEAEWVLDIGEVRTAAGAFPIREMELELLHGEPRALYDLALAIHGQVRMRPSTRSKAEIGFDALLGHEPAPVKAWRIRVAEDATTDQMLGAIFRECLRHVLSNERAAERGDDPEGVHQMRVGVRRFRSALHLFHDLLPVEATHKLDLELRWLARELGNARDWDVFCEETLGGLRRLGMDEPGFKLVCDESDAERLQAYEHLRAALRTPRYGSLVLALGRWVEAAEWRDQPLSERSARLFGPARSDAVVRLGRLHLKAMKLGRKVEDLEVEDLHRLRIRLKRLRYASEFLGNLFGRKANRKLSRRLAGLQEALGHLNDTATAEARVDSLIRRLEPASATQPARAAGFLLGWISRGAQDELRELPRRWRSFARIEPFWE